jgi:hypothetical protein
MARPEWELRRAKEPGTRLVPDMELVLEAETDDGVVGKAWFIELDAGTERSAVWEAKAEAYSDACAGGALYGGSSWRVLAVVPSMRRARTVAAAVTRRGAGKLVFLAVQTDLEEGRALAPSLVRAEELDALGDAAAPRRTLLGEPATEEA